MNYEEFNLTGKGILTIVTGILIGGFVLANLSTYLVDLVML